MSYKEDLMEFKNKSTLRVVEEDEIISIPTSRGELLIEIGRGPDDSCVNLVLADEKAQIIRPITWISIPWNREEVELDQQAL